MGLFDWLCKPRVRMIRETTVVFKTLEVPKTVARYTLNDIRQIYRDTSYTASGGPGKEKTTFNAVGSMLPSDVGKNNYVDVVSGEIVKTLGSPYFLRWRERIGIYLGELHSLRVSIGDAVVAVAEIEPLMALEGFALARGDLVASSRGNTPEFTPKLINAFEKLQKGNLDLSITMAGDLYEALTTLLTELDTNFGTVLSKKTDTEVLGDYYEEDQPDEDVDNRRNRKAKKG